MEEAVASMKIKTVGSSKMSVATYKATRTQALFRFTW